MTQECAGNQNQLGFDNWSEVESTRAMLDQLFIDSRLYTQSKDYKELLDFVVRLPNSAQFNAMLLQVQKPGLKFAASAHDWRDRFGREPKPKASIVSPSSGIQTSGAPGQQFLLGCGSYRKRYELLCRSLVLERVYSSACLVMATNSPKTKTQPAGDLSFQRFVARLRGHVVAFLGSK